MVKEVGGIERGGRRYFVIETQTKMYIYLFKG